MCEVVAPWIAKCCGQVTGSCQTKPRAMRSKCGPLPAQPGASRREWKRKAKRFQRQAASSVRGALPRGSVRAAPCWRRARGGNELQPSPRARQRASCPAAKWRARSRTPAASVRLAAPPRPNRRTAALLGGARAAAPSRAGPRKMVARRGVARRGAARRERPEEPRAPRPPVHSSGARRQGARLALLQAVVGCRADSRFRTANETKP